MPAKRNVPEIINTSHVKQRMNERFFSEDDVQFIYAYGDKEYVRNGCIQYTLTDDVPLDVKNDLFYQYNRGRKIILTSENVLKTVIADDELKCSFTTYREYVV
jgi:hypothetical protein